MTSATTQIRVGVIGTGAISQVVHVPIFSEREDVELFAMADTDPHKAETISRRFDVPVVLDADELLDADQLDAVVICTPNAFHEEQAIAALNAGKHVLVERPLALTAEGASRVVAAAEKAERVLMVGLPHRFRPGVAALRDYVAGGELGEIYAARGSWMRRPTPSPGSNWRKERDVAGGGALMDLGVSALDLCLWVMGYPEVKRLSATLGLTEDGVESAASLMAETADGSALTLEVSDRLFAQEDRFDLRVLGTDGSASLPPLQVFKQIGGRPSDETPRQPRPQGGESPYMNAYRRLLDHFVRAVSGVTEAELPREQPALMAVIEAAYQAAAEGREVSP